MKNHYKYIIENYINAYNRFDIEGMIKDLDENIVFENVTNGDINLNTEGIEAFKEQAEAAKQYFEKRKQTIESWEISDPIVEIKISYKATVAIDLPNGLKKGDTLELAGSSIFEIENEKIKRITDKS